MGALCHFLLLNAVLAVGHEVVFSDGKQANQIPEYKLSFQVKGDKIEFGAKVAVTDKWFAFGISSSGGMKGTDIALFTPKSDAGIDSFTLQDYWSIDYAAPTLDKKQSLELISANVKNGIAEVKWSRNLVSCDAEDLDVVNATVPVVFAVGSGKDFTYHGVRRGGRYLNLFIGDTSQADEAALPTDLVEFEIAPTVPIVIEPEETTQYHCLLTALNLTMNGDHHIVKQEPVLTSEFAHHMLFFSCEHEIKEWTYKEQKIPVTPGIPFRCSLMTPQSCRNIGAWAVGRTTWYAGPEIGTRFRSTARFIFTQYHVDNPQKKSGVDSSGQKFFITPTLRPHDSVAIQLMTNDLKIPPKMESSFVTTDLPAECSKKATEEAEVFAVNFHMHQMGTRTWVEHWRGGKRLDDVAFQHWDFNYQNDVELPKRVVIIPGDHLRLVCEFNSMKKTSVTTFGDGSDDEMCIALLRVLPKAPIVAAINHQQLLKFSKPPAGEGVILCMHGPSSGDPNDPMERNSNMTHAQRLVMLQKLRTTYKLLPDPTNPTGHTTNPKCLETDPPKTDPPKVDPQGSPSADSPTFSDRSSAPHNYSCLLPVGWSLAALWFLSHF